VLQEKKWGQEQRPLQCLSDPVLGKQDGKRGTWPLPEGQFGFAPLASGQQVLQEKLAPEKSARQGTQGWQGIGWKYDGSYSSFLSPKFQFLS
jgi:hypothetical protein